MDASTLAVALSYIKKQVEEAKEEGFKVQIERDRSILSRVGKEKVFYFLPKDTSNPQDGYDEFVYVNGSWEKVGGTSEGTSISEVYIGNEEPTGEEIVWIDTASSSPSADGYILTPKDKVDIANIVLQELPTTQGVLYGNTSN